MECSPSVQNSLTYGVLDRPSAAPAWSGLDSAYRQGGSCTVKIVFLSREVPDSLSMLRLVHDKHTVMAVIFEETPSLLARIRKRLKLRSLSDLLVGGTRRLVRSLVNALGGGPRRRKLDLLPRPMLPKGLSVHRVSSINAPESKALLDALQPDVVLVRGTSLIRDEILAEVPLTLNVHAGLSPYYRGSHCTEWALLNWDPYNIGVTVHEITRAIDGGAIYGQVRVPIEPLDTVASIEEKICFEGARLFESALTHLETGAELPLHPQPKHGGSLRLGLHWDAHCEARVRSLQRPSLMSSMLKRPSRRKRPIIHPGESPS
jgi:hypothetical protein